MVSDLSRKQELMVVENAAAVARREKKRKSAAAEIDLDGGDAVIELDCGSSAASTVTDQEQFDDHYGNSERGRQLGRARAARHNKAQRLEQGRKMERIYNQSQPELKHGTIVSLKVDDRDVPRGSHRGILAVVFDFKKETGGVQVVTPSGIIKTGRGNPLFFPRDKHEVKPDNVIIGHPKLVPLVAAARGGNFVVENYPTQTIARAYKAEYGGHPVPKRGCGCKKGSCTGNCGCKKEKVGCGPKCSCRGKCSNPFNVNNK